jgi:hypothetical protein
MTTTAHPDSGTRQWRSVARHRLRVPESDALGWDVPFGYADDPDDLTGRAALAARYLAVALTRSGPAVGGWIRRHTLREHESRFSFWSPSASADVLRQAVDTLDRTPAPGSLTDLVDAQLAQSRGQRAVPHVVLFRAMDRAAWGRSAATASGDETTLAAVLAGDFPGYLGECVARSRLVPVAPEPARHAVATPDWRGDVVMVDRPGLQCRVAVQRVLAPHLADPAALAVFAEYLDGPDGLVQRRLRTEAGLAYGATAIPHQDGRVCTLVVAASMLVENLSAGLDAVRRVIAEIDRGGLDPDRLAESLRRARHKLRGQLDGPFGALEERRRTVEGLPLVSDTLAGLDAATERLAGTPRWSAAYRPAVCFVGDPGIVDRKKLEAALW